MSFNFGNTSTTGLGSTSTPAKPLTFGAPQQSTFGFGTSAAPPPAFGASTTTFGIGTPALGQTNPPSFGFGTSQPAANPPTFGSSFGTLNASTAAPTFGLGSSTTSTAPTFGGFGSTLTQPTSFGFGAATSQPSLGFNMSTSSNAAQSFGAFGQTATQQPSLFGQTTGGFGTGGAFGATNQFQNQQQQQQQLKPPTEEELFAQSIFNVCVFGDERDTTIARWNYMQALLGTGKAFYSQSQSPVVISPQNYLCRFKAVGYSRIPGKDNKQGLVSVKFSKPLNQVKEIEPQLIPKFSQLFGSKPNMIVHIESIKALNDTTTQVNIYIEEKSQTSNEVKRITATETAAYLNQPQLKYQLTPLGIVEAVANIPPDEDQLKEYLENVPKGIDARMWKQAITDNPDPKKFIPVPLIGFNDLKSRLTCQENETASHMGYLAKLEKDVGELKQRQSNTTAKMIEHRRKFAELSHRILKIIVKQESSRKSGIALTPEEEAIKTKLENMHALVSAPTQFKGKLSELLSQMRMQRSQWGSGGLSEYTLDAASQEEMKNFLTVQQNAMQFLIETVNKDVKDLKIISDGLAQMNSTAPVM